MFNTKVHPTCDSDWQLSKFEKRPPVQCNYLQNTVYVGRINKIKITNLKKKQQFWRGLLGCGQTFPGTHPYTQIKPGVSLWIGYDNAYLF